MTRATALRALAPWPQTPGAEAVLAVVPDAVLVIDAADRIRQVNPAAEQMLGLAAGALVGLGLADLVGADGALLPLVERARRDGGVVTAYDVPVRSPRADLPETDVRAVLVDEAGYVVIVLRERVGARRLGEQVGRESAGRSLAGLAAMLAHEVRNPLSGIRGAAQLVAADLPDGQRELATLIVAEADRIRALVDSMEAIGDPAAGPRGPVNIHEVLDHVRRVAGAGVAKGFAIRDAFDPSLPPVEGNRDRLVQLFLNLVKNAAEACGPKGTITLRTAFDHGRRRGGVAMPIVVSVEDDGPGIPDSIRSRLFEPFATTRHTGRGLGLAIVAAIAADHGGTVEVDARPGRTVFRVALRAAREGAAP
jgi:two-component system nitrogen regulation sensor histidine kinase GlnL